MIASSFFTYLLHYTLARTVYDWLFNGHGHIQEIESWAIVIVPFVIVVLAAPIIAKRLRTGFWFPQEQRGYFLQRGREKARERAAKRRKP